MNQNAWEKTMKMILQWKKGLSILAILSAIAVPNDAKSINYTWNAPFFAGDWNESSNWLPAGGPPTSVDNGVINNLGSAFVIDTRYINNLTLAGNKPPSEGSNEVDIFTQGKLSILGTCRCGDNVSAGGVSVFSGGTFICNNLILSKNGFIRLANGASGQATNFTNNASGTGTGLSVATGATWRIKNSTGKGKINLEDGGNLVIVGGGTISNPIDISGAGNTFVGLGGTQAATTLAGDLSGSGNVTVSGATYTYAGSSNWSNYSGTYTVGDSAAGAAAGAAVLTLNGGLAAGTMVVSPVGVLSGITLANSTVDLVSSGVVSPGFSPGTFNVGSYVNNGTGTYKADIAPGGISDLINASGTATLNGGTLDVIAAPGIYLKGATYTLINANGGLTGTFATTILPPALQLLVNYLPTQLVLTNEATVIDIPGLKGNPLRVAEYLAANGTLTGDLGLVIAALTNPDPKQVSKYLDQLHPAIFEALSLTAGDAAHLVTTSLMDRLNFIRNRGCANVCDPCANPSERGVWVAGGYDYIRQERTQGLRRFNTSTEEFALGFDNQICDSIYGGIGAGYTHTNLHWGSSAGRARINSFYLAAYATKFDDCYYMDAALTSFVNNNSVRRHINFNAINRRAKNNHYSYGFNPHFGAGLNLNYCTVDVIPFFNLDYYYVHQNRAREHGARSLNLHVKRNDSNLLRVETGFRFTKCYEFCGGNLIPSASISYVGHRLMSGRKYTSSFSGIDDNFSVYGTDHCFNQLELGAGATYVIGQNLAVNAWYDVELGRKRQEQEFNVEVNYSF